MGCILSAVERHASVRKYLSDPVPEEDVERILEASRRAPSGWNLQPYTVIAVRDKAKLRELADVVGGQEHVAQAPLLLVYVVDYAKVVEAAELLGLKLQPSLVNLYEALIDVGIAAGWAALAAEELGYGVCFIALYSNPCPVAEILQLPRYTIPAVALTVGKPAESPQPRKRQPLETLSDSDIYSPAAVKAEALLKVYGSKAPTLFRHLFGPEGYYQVGNMLLRSCLEKQGFQL